MKKLLHDDYIFFSVPGGVSGIHYEEVNKIIDRYNKDEIYHYSSFIDYFNYCMQQEGSNTTYYNFSCLWNEGRTGITKMHTIKSA